MYLTIQIKILNNVKYRHAICLKLGGRFFTSQNMLGCEAKVNICSAIKENLISYCRKFSALVVVVINQHILITRSILQRNAACKVCNRVISVSK